MNREEKLGICVVINDFEKELLREIVAQNGSLEDGALLKIDGETEDSAYRIPLDTKYYSCEFILWNLSTFEIANKWFDDHKCPPIFALFVKADLLKFSKNPNDFFNKTRQAIARFKANTQAIVLKFPKISPEQDDFAELLAKRNSLQKFCEETAELIELNTPKEWTNEDDLESCQFGIDRVIELLGIGFSDCGKAGFNQALKSNPVELPAHQNKLKKYIETAEEDWGKELKVVPKDYPDSDDEAAIMEMFDRPIVELSKIPADRILK